VRFKKSVELIAKRWRFWGAGSGFWWESLAVFAVLVFWGAVGRIADAIYL
jgi:hypothetical protein